MNWFGKILGMPREFLNESEGPGGGVLQVHGFATHVQPARSVVSVAGHSHFVGRLVPNGHGLDPGKSENADLWVGGETHFSKVSGTYVFEHSMTTAFPQAF